MKSFAFASLRGRLLTSFVVMLLPFAILAAGTYVSIQRATHLSLTLVEEVQEEMHPITHVEKTLLKLTVAIEEFAHGPASSRQATRTEVGKLSDTLSGAFEQALSAPFAEATEDDLVRRAYQEWEQAQTALTSLLDQGTISQDPQADLQRFRRHMQQAGEILDRFDEYAHEEMDDQLVVAQGLTSRILIMIVILFVIGGILAVSVALSLARSILRPISSLKQGVAHFGRGHLSHRITLNTNDAFQGLAEAFNSMACRIQADQEQLKELSIRDELTGLFNHRQFYYFLKLEIERALRHGPAFSLLLLDIDKFKAVNDTYGHLVGDEVLETVARTLRLDLRKIDHVARYGGEEIGIILPGTDTSNAVSTAERIRKLIAAEPAAMAQDQEIYITVSIGIAVFPDDATTPRNLVNAADQALYCAKRQGRNQICLYHGSDDEAKTS